MGICSAFVAPRIRHALRGTVAMLRKLSRFDHSALMSTCMAHHLYTTKYNPMNTLFLPMRSLRRVAAARMASMAEGRPPTLVETKRRDAEGATRPHPLLLLGGPFHPSFSLLQDWFARKGFESVAAYPALADQAADVDFGYDLAEAVRGSIPSAFPPVIISVGFGAHVASKYLESHPATAVVFVTPSAQFTSTPKLLAQLRASHPDDFSKAMKSNNLLELRHLVYKDRKPGPAGGLLPLNDFVAPPPFLREPTSIFKIETATASRLPMLVVEFENNLEKEARRASDEDIAANRLDCDYIEIGKGDGGIGWIYDEEVVDSVCESIYEWMDGQGL